MLEKIDSDWFMAETAEGMERSHTWKMYQIIEVT